MTYGEHRKERNANSVEPAGVEIQRQRYGFVGCSKEGKTTQPSRLESQAGRLYKLTEQQPKVQGLYLSPFRFLKQNEVRPVGVYIGFVETPQHC